MSNLQKNLDRVISTVQRRLVEAKNIIPVKTQQGLLVGNVLIVSRGALKDLIINSELVYGSISLNKVAIKMANLLALSPFKYRTSIDKLYEADENFGKALEDYQIFRKKYNEYKHINPDQADIYMARMCYSRDKATYYKKQALGLL